MIEEIEKLAKEMEFKHGYVRVRTPHLSKEDLFLHSGHLPYYAESMYPPMELEGVKYYVKPMNCPMHHKIYASKPRSYRDLPLRLAEYGTCYRYEKSGELFGLMRVRSMQMNDSHIYCSEKQFEQEFTGGDQPVPGVLQALGHQGLCHAPVARTTRAGWARNMSTTPSCGSRPKTWCARRWTKHIIFPYIEVSDEAAFYGPKIDVQVSSAIGREFSLATNQVDFAQSERFNLTFINEAGPGRAPADHPPRPALHARAPDRLPAGALRRGFPGLAVARTGAHHPHHRQAERSAARPLRPAARRWASAPQLDLDSDRMNAKIRKAQLMKVPYMVVLGEREVRGEARWRCASATAASKRCPWMNSSPLSRTASLRVRPNCKENHFNQKMSDRAVAHFLV